jgi:hypothetical protein
MNQHNCLSNLTVENFDEIADYCHCSICGKLVAVILPGRFGNRNVAYGNVIVK